MGGGMAEPPQGDVQAQLMSARQLARDYRAIAARIREQLDDRLAHEASTAESYDVVVIGAGPLGLAYSHFLLERRPGLRIAVVDRRDGPGYKVGESTLGGSVRGFKSMGLNNAALRRLFEGKFGLALWWTGPEGGLGPHVDIGHFDETIQVERRVLETALAAAVARRGVDIRRGTRVLAARSTFGADGNELVCEGPDRQELRLRARVVCDASGPAAVIPRALGLHHKRIDTFQTNAYFGYFRKKSHPDLAYWDTPMTRHVMFPEGWVWFIDLVSWEATPDDRLEAVVELLLDQPDGPDASYPTRDQLIERFGCTIDHVTSIGIVPRDDLDDSKGAPVEERFWHWVERYPGLGWIMDHFEPVEGHYEGHRSFSAFQRMAHDSERVAGDGWVAIGDAAMFVNPLFSPGMTFGMATAFVAADDTVHALNRSDTRARSFARYEDYARDLFTQLLRENDLFYRGFAHPESFERTWMLKFAQSTTWERGPSDRYSAADLYLTNLLEPRYRDLVETVVALQREQEQAGVDPADTAQRVRELVDPYLDSIAARPGHREARFDRFFSRYDADFHEVGDKPDREVAYPTWRCPVDGNLIGDDARACFVCGEPRPEDAVPGHILR